jgi:GT2 family glycosyltransferase
VSESLPRVSTGSVRSEIGLGNEAEAGLVSIITPCFNAAEFVGETVRSVQAQTQVRVEHIVVDDASTDDSWAVVQSFGDGVQAVRLERNGGGAHARNVGAALAHGEFLMFLDADDVLAAPDTLATLVAAVRARPGAIGVCPWCRLRQEADGVWTPVAAEVALPVAGADHIRKWIEGTCWVPSCAVLWRRDVYTRTGGWDETLTLDDDVDLMLRALLDGAVLVTVNGGEGYYRSHATTRVSVSNNLFSADRLASRLRVTAKIAERLAGAGKLGEYAVPLGAAYQRAAMAAYQHGLLALGRACQARGEELAGPQPVSRTLVGQALSHLFGLERKERLAQAMATWGIGPRWRRELAHRYALRAETTRSGIGPT